MFGLHFVDIIIIIRVPGVIMRDRPETEADLGTLPAGGLGFSGVSSWWAIRLDAPLRNDGLVPVLLLRRRMRRRLETIPSRIRKQRVRPLALHKCKITKEKNAKRSVFVSLTLLLGRDGKARHDVEALGAVHHQRAGTAL